VHNQREVLGEFSFVMFFKLSASGSGVCGWQKLQENRNFQYRSSLVHVSNRFLSQCYICC
jgi:hypothetical protein